MLQDFTSRRCFKVKRDTCINVLLIRSDYLPVVSSKLLVYKNFQHLIKEKEIFVQHEYDDFDDVAKLIANKLFSSFCSFVESMIHAFTIDLHKIFTDKSDQTLEAKKIKSLCLNVFKRIENIPLGSVNSGRY